MKIEDARRFALSLPGVTEQPHFELSSFRIGTKIFATVPPGDELLHVFVDEHGVRAAGGLDPSAFEELWWGHKLAGLRVRLSCAPPEVVRDLLETAWRRKATKRLRLELDSGRGAAVE